MNLAALLSEFANELIRREAFERLHPARKIVSGDEVREMRPQLGVRFVEVAFDRRVLDRAVHSLDLPIGPRMLRFRQPMVDIVAGACKLEGVRAECRPWASISLISAGLQVWPAGSVK